MLTNMNWLKKNKSFPPSREAERIKKYNDNLAYFNTEETASLKIYAKRISRVIGNFSEMVSFPLILNYQKLVSTKMADMVCGEYPIVSCKDPKRTEVLKKAVSASDFNSKIYTTVIDISRYGDAVWRLFLNEEGKIDFTVWDPRQWFPISYGDGTNRFKDHVLCWIEESDDELRPTFTLVAQVHEVGFYTQHKFQMNSGGSIIGERIGTPEKINTGLNVNAVIHVKAFATSDTPYGHDDYESIDCIVKELETRCAQINTILDKHADPSLAGPPSMLTLNVTTGTHEFIPGRYYSVANGENYPEYLTWDGQLDAAFKQIEVLINQLYILSEMGAAIAGEKDADGQAVSAEAMRYKLVTPLNKARRVSNALTLASRKLLAAITSDGYEQAIEAEEISIEWRDGLPDDPRAIMEYAKVATGENKIMPLSVAISRILGKTEAEAQEWIATIDERSNHLAEMAAEPAKMSLSPTDDSGKPGPNKGNAPAAKNSQGISNFKSPKND